MGNKATKGVALKPKDVAKYAGTGCERAARSAPGYTSNSPLTCIIASFSPFHAVNPEEIQTLYAQFMSWKTPGSSDAPVITDA